MSWKLSRFRAGALVEVRSREDILATLDADGCVDGMPFMPEMFQYCGRRLRVSAVAHKACDVARLTLRSRRLEASVHLAGARCDGSAHGGCEAECNLFWKDAWLKPAEGGGAGPVLRLRGHRRASAGEMSESELRRRTRLRPESEPEEPVYSCQATNLFRASAPLAWWDPRQYLRDVVTGNHSVGHVVSVLLVASVKHLHARAPRGYRLTRAVYEFMHRSLLRRERPDVQGALPLGQPTPTGRLDLKPGQRVRIKSKEEIQATLDVKGRNRGLYFDVEMSPYCGTVTTVRRSVTRIIDEASGRMRQMQQPCIVLDDVACRAEYSKWRLMCPRAIQSYWREIWLERVEAGVDGGMARRTEARDCGDACQSV